MKKAILLYTDHGLSANLLPAAFAEKFNAVVFNLTKEGRKEIELKTPLGEEFKICFDKAKLIPQAAFDKLLQKFITKNQPQQLIIFNYPYSEEQNKGMKEILLTHNYELAQAIFFLIKDPKAFLQAELKTPEVMSSKYYDEFEEGWNLNFQKKREMINIIKSSITNDLVMKDIYTSFHYPLTREYWLKHLIDFV